MSDRKKAERAVGFAKFWARAKQVLTTDPTGSDEDDLVVDEEAARVLAAQAGRLKGGLAKVAQLAAYDPGAHLGKRSGATAVARQVLGGLWDRAPAVSSGAIAAVIEKELGQAPQALFAHWDPNPLASASLGQVHAARAHDGTELVVKVQYPGVADALRADLDDDQFLRKLVGSVAQLGDLDEEALHALAGAVRLELDYRQEAASLDRFAAAWDGDPVLRFPRVVPEHSATHVLTMTRARGISVIDASHATPDVRRQAALGIFRFTWGSPLVHGLLNADPNPGNFLVETLPDGHVHVWCLDFGCSINVATETRDADREIWYGLLDEDSGSATERFRMGLAASGILRRPDLLASTAIREWERALAQPIRTHGDFAWTSAYGVELAETTGRALALGGLGLSARILLLWRQRLGAAAVIGLLDARASFRRVLFDLIGTGKRALR